MAYNKENTTVHCDVEVKVKIGLQCRYDKHGDPVLTNASAELLEGMLFDADSYTVVGYGVVDE